MEDHYELLYAVAQGSKPAFAELYQIFAPNVYNTAIGYVQNKSDAEEITQDVFTSIFRYASSFKGDSKLSTWIYRITVNTSLNMIKKNKRRAPSNLDMTSHDKVDFVHPGVLLENQESAKILFKVIYSLPTQQQTAFILSYVEDLPRQEVADIMETSLKAVESLLQRAKKNLRDKLEKLYPYRRNFK